MTQLPLREFSPLSHIDYFWEWLDHPHYDDYWRGVNIETHYERVKAAALNIGGWYDIFLGGTVRNFLGLRARGGSEAARQSRLLVGPWAHVTRALLWQGNLVGDVDFGLGGSAAGIDLTGIQLRWFDKWLKESDSSEDQGSAVRLFVTGDNVWQDETEFPPVRSQPATLFLRSEGQANTLDGEGLLAWDGPGDEAPDHFKYDPLNPVPTVGGGLCCSDVHLPGGAYDQREVERRPDVLVYTSAPCENSLSVVGAVKVRLFVATTAVDTDFTAKFIDVRPDGNAQNLADGILRLRYRNGFEREEPVEPGQVYEVSVDLAYVAHTFKNGHAIRLEISSSNFPRFDRNPRKTGL